MNYLAFFLSFKLLAAAVRAVDIYKTLAYNVRSSEVGVVKILTKLSMF